MAQQVNVKFVDDLDGTDAAGTVSFGIDGKTYEIDLSDDNAARLRDSLAVFVGYPDLVQIFTGTVLNQTGQAVEVVMITMAVYLSISLVTSMAMNWYNSRIALVER